MKLYFLLVFKKVNSATAILSVIFLFYFTAPVGHFTLFLPCLFLRFGLIKLSLSLNLIPSFFFWWFVSRGLGVKGPEQWPNTLHKTLSNDKYLRLILEVILERYGSNGIFIYLFYELLHLNPMYCTHLIFYEKKKTWLPEWGAISRLNNMLVVLF